MQRELVCAAGWTGVGLVDATFDLSCLDGAGRWFVVAPFEGQPVALRMQRWRPGQPVAPSWPGVSGWRSTVDRDEYVKYVQRVRSAIAAGSVYQVNACRLLSAPCAADIDIAGLWGALQIGNPAPHAALVQVDHPLLQRLGLAPIEIASASPELFLSRHGSELASAPIKGTAAPAADFLDKDRAENIMIVDLVRNDLSAVCEAGTVEVRHLLERQSHPGLDHLVSTVVGQLREGCSWSEILSAAFPPGSVTGAPKLSAMNFIAANEPARSFYCGSLGVVDADNRKATLNVAIRSFWKSADRLWFGTGAGITWGSDPELEWQETELKARRLIEIASTPTGAAA